MEQKESKPEFLPIYSRWVVLGFCVFFSPVFGGFLLRQNLRDKGQKALGSLVLLVSFAMAMVTALVSSTQWRGPGTTFALNLLQGAILVEYVFRTHFVEDEFYPKKSMRKPLMVSFLVILLILSLMQLTGVPLTPQ
jgi:glycerol uptake facilitator-like aquaporin